jgi:tetratricopeptide (TPR) repeat protein
MRNFPLSLALIVSLGNLLRIPAVQANSCQIVARVMQGSKETGKGLCKNQSISFSAPVRAACTLVRGVVWVKTSEDLVQCESSQRADRPCSSVAEKACARKRGELSQDKPRLIQPYGEILLQSPRQIRWISVLGADAYAVTVLGDKTWKFKTSQPVLNLPTLSSQSSIQFVIEAFAKGRLLSTAIKTYNFLDANQQRQVNNDLALIQTLQLTPMEKVALQLSIYADAGLLDSSVFLLQQQILKQPQNPANVRSLADIYLDAGLYDDAFTAYGKAKAIAIKARNRDEVQRAEEGLRLISSLETGLEKGG